jgi:hypothetical protein
MMQTYIEQWAAATRKVRKSLVFKMRRYPTLQVVDRVERL